MVNNGRAINRVFTRKVLDDLFIGRSNAVFECVVEQYIADPCNKTHCQIFSEIYAHLRQENRNEYYYMNTLLNKLLLGKHSVNTTTALSQVTIGQHIADFVMLNGEGGVYEIKSDLDSFDRSCQYVQVAKKARVRDNHTKAIRRAARSYASTSFQGLS